MKQRLHMLLAILAFLLMVTGPGVPRDRWVLYSNEKFGYSVRVPEAMQVANRASDGSGVTWQTGTVRIQVSGSSNPYRFKSQDYMARIRRSAGAGLVDLKQGKDTATGAEWVEALFTKDGRRVHQKTYLGPSAVHSLEFSYAYRYRKEKEGVGHLVVESFRPGKLD